MRLVPEWINFLSVQIFTWDTSSKNGCRIHLFDVNGKRTVRRMSAWHYESTKSTTVFVESSGREHSSMNSQQYHSLLGQGVRSMTVCMEMVARSTTASPFLFSRATVILDSVSTSLVALISWIWCKVIRR